MSISGFTPRFFSPTRWLPVVLAGLTLAACGGGGNGNGNGQHGGPTDAEAAQLIAAILSRPVEVLSPAESAGLVWVREEEKLAHDVYAVAATRWGLQTFINIGASETMHMGAMKALLDRYTLVDPNAGMTDGQFQRPEFQTLYTQLTSKVDLSLVDALQVGLEIEELDIKDIETEKLSVDNADVLYAYNELLRGSRNHLRAFWKQLQQQGGSYTPSHITQAAFDAIINSATETTPVAATVMAQ
jgi:hypothetical protein